MPRKHFVFMFALLISSIVGLYFVEVYFKKNRLEEIEETLSAVSSNLEAQIYSDIHHTNTLSAIAIAIAEINKSEQQWSYISRSIFSKSKHLKVLGIAPNDIIESIYPIEGNKRALGLNYRTIPEQWSAIQEAKATETIHISKPLELVQGGLSIIAFNPIFLDPPENNKYWGNSGAVLDINSLFKSEVIMKMDNQYDLSVKSIGHGVNRDEEYFLLGTSEMFSKSVLKTSIIFPSNEWVVSISLNDSVNDSNVIRFVGWGGVIIFHFLILLVYSQYCSLYNRSVEDELTKLTNRRFFMSNLKKNIKSAIKRNKCFAIVNLDLNGFKMINDTYGHSCGDDVLIEVARRINLSVRNVDLVSRIGGDEFLIYLSSVKDEKQVMHIINRIHSIISNEPVVANGVDIWVKSSIGYYFNQGLDISVEEALAAADSSMYDNKKNSVDDHV